MPRSRKGKAAQASPTSARLANLLAADPAAAVIEVLRRSEQSLTAGAIKAALVNAGADVAAASSAWNKARDRVRFDDHVEVVEGGKGNSYRWSPRARQLSPEEAVYRLSRNPDAVQRARLLAVIQSALQSAAADPAALADARQKVADAERRIGALEHELAKAAKRTGAAKAASRTGAEAASQTGDAEAASQTGDAEATSETGGGAAERRETPAGSATPHDQYERAERRRAARERQARIDAMSTVAELAAEVEELTAKRATAQVLLEHTRALTEERGLEAIGRAGEPTEYDETRHHPVGDFPNEGDPVTVIRPGYLWHAPGEAVLISKALVTRA
jgi:hypothetical protein